MRKKLGKRGFAALAGTMVVAAPVAAACSTGPTYDEWAATDGAAGRINLDEVQEAFKDSKDVSAFERRVNEIYEGDGIVLIRAQQAESGLTLEGFEDLNNNGKIDDTADDKLFSIFKDNENRHRMQGHGGNSYYNRGFTGTDFLFTYLIISSLSGRGGYGYNTPRGNTSRMRRDRNSYRASSKYRNQVSKNTTFRNSNRSQFSGSRAGTARQTYLNTQKRTSAFKTGSRTGVRSTWGSKGTGSRFGRPAARTGGFRGGGGAQTIIGRRRPLHG